MKLFSIINEPNCWSWGGTCRSFLWLLLAAFFLIIIGFAFLFGKKTISTTPNTPENKKNNSLITQRIIGIFSIIVGIIFFTTFLVSINKY